MRRRSISTATALAVLLGSAALTVLPATTASAAGSVTVHSSGGMIADDINRRVFVADQEGGEVFSADYSGAKLKTSVGLGTLYDLVLSPDAGTLYVAAPTEKAVVALDAATLAVKKRYAVTTDTGPRRLAFAAGKVWFTYGDQWSGNLGSIDVSADPASDADPVTLGLYGGRVWGQALLDTDPSAPNLLVLGETGLSTSSMAVLDVSGETPTEVAWHNGDYSLNYGISDIDLVPGAQEVLVNGTVRDAWADGTFRQAGKYPSGQKADIAPGGLVAQANSNKLAVYKPNAATPVRTFTLGTSGSVGTADLTWSPDSSRVFALVGSSDKYTLKVLTDPSKDAPKLTVDAPSSATRARQLTVKGKITASVPLPSGVKLKVTRTDLESPNGKALPSVSVKADGTYSFKDTPPAGGTVTYKVSYAGDAEHAAVGASDKVEVSRATTSLSLNNKNKKFSYGADVKFTAHLGTTYKNRTVEIYADPYGPDKPKKLVKSGKVSSHGNLSVTLDMKRDTTVTAVYKGDSRYKPKTFKITAYAKVKISTSLSKHYRKAKIGSKTYHWFRKNTDPVFTSTMSYYPGRQQRFDLQVYAAGSWHSVGSDYYPLGTSGKTILTLGAPGESGIKARMRSVYVNGSSGDNVNTTTYSSWKYLYFTN